MTFSMSGVENGWSYNRFDIYEKRNKKEECPKCGEDECECDEPVKEGLDPVGKEDGDVDNDGDKDSSDKYLLKRRKAIGKAMKKEEVVLEGDFPKDAPSIKDAKQEKKTDVKYYKGLGIAPVVKKEEVELEEGSCGSKGYQKGGMVSGYQKGGVVKPAKNGAKDAQYGAKKEELEQTGLFTDAELDKIIEQMFYEEEN